MLTVMMAFSVAQASGVADCFPELQDPHSSDLRIASKFLEEHLLSLDVDPLEIPWSTPSHLCPLQ